MFNERVCVCVCVYVYVYVCGFLSVIQNVIHLMPKPCYLLAVDNSQDTLEDIVKV